MNVKTVTAASPHAVLILPASFRDVLPLYRLEKRCFPVDSWPLIDIVAAMLLPRIVSFKAVRGNEIIGFVMGERDRDLGWIATFGVDPEHRQMGVGTQLLRKLEQVLDTSRFRLCVRASNEAAIHLYRKHGYRSVDVWPGYYKGGEDALVMEKNSAASTGMRPGF